jgi:hypothetical protein
MISNFKIKEYAKEEDEDEDEGVTQKEAQMKKISKEN